MKKLSLLITILSMVIITYAQTRSVSGKILDETGAPVPFATVTEQGTTNSVSANESGSFTIQLRNSSSSLIVTATGFTSLTINPSDASSIRLTRDVEQMQEVIVTTALGVQRQAKALGYSTSKIDNAELTKVKSVNVQQGLAGKVSGLNITTTNNGVFENTKIMLRGLRSLTGNNQPLLVLDGTPVSIGYLSSINPNDVADVNILKGASGAAIYGPDGVNGVIIVNTKKGTRNKPLITLSSAYQVSKVGFLPKRQREFGNGSSVDQFGQPLYNPYENFSYGDRFDGTMRILGVPIEDGSEQMVKYEAQKEDQMRKFFNEHGAVFQNDVSFATQDFYISFQDAQIKGMVPNDENRRTSFRFNASKEYNRFKASFNIGYIQSNYDVMSQNGFAGRYASAYSGSIYNLVLQVAPHVPLSDYKDWRNSKWAQYSNYYNEYSPNPYWAIDNHRSIGRTDDLLGSLDLKYEIASWLQATARVGTNFTLDAYKTEISPIVVTDWAKEHRDNTTYNNIPGIVGDEQDMSSRINGEFFLTGKKNVSDFGISYLAGTSVRQNYAKEMIVQGNNLVVPYLFNISNRTGEVDATEENEKYRLTSLFGSLSLNYKSWAFVEVTGRNDWDSRLSVVNNSYFYPGVNASIVLSDAMPSLKSNNIISYAKIRGSVSKSGNVNLNPYSLQSTYAAAGGFPYGNLPGFTAQGTTVDPNLKPEFVNSREVGIELGFLRNRINFDATYYNQRNTDQILTIQQSYATGFANKLANTADFKNYGFELDLKLTPLVNLGEARFDLKLNATYNDNEILRLADDINELAIGGSTGFIQLKAGAPDAFNYAIVGQPAFVFKLSDYERDPLGRVIVDPVTGNPSLSDSLVVMGRSLPKWMVGVVPSFSWKSLSIGMTWDYKTGHHAYHGLGSDMDGYGISARSAQYGRERFVFPNSVYWDGSKYVENTDRQVSSGGIGFWGDDASNAQIGTNYFTSAAAWRLRELAISYDLPKSIIGNGKILQKATISLIGRNLLLFLPDSNQWTDPEFNYSSTNNTLGVSSVFQTPSARTFGANVTLTF